MPPRVQCPRLGVSFQQSRCALLSRTQPSPASLTIAWVQQHNAVLAPRSYATAAPVTRLQLPADYVPPTQPPSARRPEIRKTQLLRSYTALLKSTPLTLIFQHNNLTAQEFAAVRRELRMALAAVPMPAAPEGAPSQVDILTSIKLQVIRTRIFSHAFKVLEFFNPAAVPTPEDPSKKVYTHDLSKAAYEAVSAVDYDNLPESSMYKQISPLLVGPIALLIFPVVSPQHLAAALSVLAPSTAFPAPTRRKSPGYHEPVTRNALQKLLLVGGRIEDRVFDPEGVRWIGGIEGGRDGLRAQVVHMLQNAGLGLTSALEGAGKSLWLTMESRRTQLEDEGKPKEEKKEEAQS